MQCVQRACKWLGREMILLVRQEFIYWFHRQAYHRQLEIFFWGDAKLFRFRTNANVIRSSSLSKSLKFPWIFHWCLPKKDLWTLEWSWSHGSDAFIYYLADWCDEVYNFQLRFGNLLTAEFLVKLIKQNQQLKFAFDFSVCRSDARNADLSW